ncbi:MAG: RluA family pseudouridine synthase [Clostridia bacterium]|nr:RluA family pseudouridine synthase [Clostridia bacterium]
MKRVTAAKNDAGQRLDKFILKYTDNMPKSLLYKAFRKKRIKVNGKRQEGDYILKEGDILELYINDEFFSDNKKEINVLKSPKIDIVYEDENIIVANKPKGVLMHGEDKENSLVDNLISYLYLKGEYNPQKEQSFTPAFCNRIDKNTEGLVIAAKNAQALREMNEKIKEGKIRKFYLCLLSNEPKEKSGEIETYLKKDEKQNKVFVCKKDEKGAKYAKTKYRVLDKTDDGVLTEVELLTGRTHQIRVHMSHIGCPIAGDVKYGAKKDGKNSYQELTSYKLYFDFEKDEKSVLCKLSKKTFSIPQKKDK